MNKQNEVISAILERRSIRRFIPGKIISEADLKLILQAGLSAPSAANRRPVHLVVVRNPELLQAFSVAKGEAEMISTSSLAIIVCGDESKQNYKEFLLEDCSAAVQNILLCIHSLGLGAVWCGIPSIIHDCYQTYTDKLGLPANIIPMAAIAAGYPDEVKTPIDRFDETKIHYEQW